MKIGDLVQRIDDEYQVVPNEIGIVVKTDESLSVTSHCVDVSFPSKIQQCRCSFLKVVN